MYGGHLQYEFEKPRRSIPSARGETRRGSASPGNSRSRPELPERLPPRRTVVCSTRLHETKPTVPLKVWVLASASCFAVCAALVLATVAITKWGSVTTEVYPEVPAPPPPRPPPQSYPLEGNSRNKPRPPAHSNKPTSDDVTNDILERLSMFKNLYRQDKSNKNPKETLTHKQQFHPAYDSTVSHAERKIEKKDHAKPNNSEHLKSSDAALKNKPSNHKDLATNDIRDIPEFKPTLPDVFDKQDKLKLPDGYIAGWRKYDNDYYTNDIFYEDDPLYDDYAQSNSMTNYLIEKIQELYDWITTDPELEGVKNSTEKIFRKKGANSSHNELGQLLKALNESIVEGNVTIVMLKLKDLYFGNENFTNVNTTKRSILRNSTDLLSFGMLTLDVMLLHNIQSMAWESQEASGIKMLQEPEVFAFNALFLDPGKVEAKRQEVIGYRESAVTVHGRYQEVPDDKPEMSFGRTVLESVLEMGLSAARAAIHLGRAYKNAKATLKQASNRETAIQNHLARNSDSNTYALNHLRTSYDKEQDGKTIQKEEHLSQHEELLTAVTQNVSDSQNGGFLSRISQNGGRNATDMHNVRYTELDCVWFLYCKNLVATGKLAAPYGTMARINGVALRLIAGELPAEKAIETLVVESMTGWTDLRCADMLPKCSHGEAATVVLDSIQLHRRAHSGNADQH